ncbi:hypothetical protein Lfu02_47440 [Longispora fulva]|uniref:DUF2752 domain-containing protein n=1 Tax=Longispora fulva TaxID=619741 RepID=A0A8J7GT47_9ACTN|nr:DUF2752 domain-containing protein [Longispora fulva]MBG6138119.1 hypothetical protein [Longispora fulva]GIG60372.1 hypothetical protein Lfu02_47440 [Longispora fulva]
MAEPVGGHVPYPYPLPEPGRFTRFMTRIVEKPPWLAPLAALACIGGGVAYTLAVDPAAAQAGATPSCAMKLLTGFDCPGCGGTRAMWYVLHGNLPEAARNHIVVLFALPFLAYMFVAWSANRVFRTRIPMLNIQPQVIAMFLVAWGVFSVLRNLPWAPFTMFFV